MNLEFFVFNNYYNRIVKKYNTIADYEAAVPTGYAAHYYDINFNPNDGVNTEIVVDTKNFSSNWAPDYLVVYDDTVQADVAIQSRWFVLEWVRLRNGQYKAVLHRDVIADHLTDVELAPMFIEKATIQFETDPAIYNTEDMQTNQIKTSEALLQDKTKNAYLVGYFAKNINWGTGEGQISNHITIPAANVPAIHTNTLSGWEWYAYTTTGGNQNYKYALAVDAKLHMSIYPQAGINNEGTVSTDGSVSVFNGTQFRSATLTGMTTGKENRIAYIRDHIAPQWTGNGNTIRNYIMTQDGYGVGDITSWDNQFLYVESGTDAGYYFVELVDNGDAQDFNFYAHDSAEEQYLAGLVSDSKYTYPDVFIDDQPCVQKQIYYKNYKLKLTKYTPIATSFDFPLSARTLSDAPYGMFVIPYNEIFVQKTGTPAAFYTTDWRSALNIACSTAEQLGSFCYDLQLLPYCPIDEAIRDNSLSVVAGTGLVEGTDYAYIKDGSNNIVNIIFFAKSSQFRVNVQKTLTIPRNVLDDHEDTYIEDYKICNQCDKYRLVAPNGAAAFDFNLAKSGPIQRFFVDCTYKPFSPYIHVQPAWGRLYGKSIWEDNKSDYRGLICQGDFSVPMITDQWVQYMINNKNYLNSFNRQVDSIELNNSVQHKMDIVNAVAGTVQGGVSGAAAGAQMSGGNPYAAAAGAVIGTATSAIAGAMDVKYNQMLRNDALDLTIDQFGYNLQNIQARPDTLAKVSSYDYNNKLWPVLEYYTATYEEKLALLNKMKYNGMTIMRIGNIAQFISDVKQYIKGKLIRCETIADDYHILTAIAEELNKGVFI